MNENLKVLQTQQQEMERNSWSVGGHLPEKRLDSQFLELKTQNSRLRANTLRVFAEPRSWKGTRAEGSVGKNSNCSEAQTSLGLSLIIEVTFL